MLVSNKAVYNCKSTNLSKCKRRIALTAIEGITQSTVSDEFVLHVPSEYDYRFMGPRKSEAIEWIQTARERLTGKSIPVNQSSQVVLKSVTLTRVEAEKRKSVSACVVLCSMHVALRGQREGLASPAGLVALLLVRRRSAACLAAAALLPSPP